MIDTILIIINYYFYAILILGLFVLNKPSNIETNAVIVYLFAPLVYFGIRSIIRRMGVRNNLNIAASIITIFTSLIFIVAPNFSAKHYTPEEKTSIQRNREIDEINKIKSNFSREAFTDNKSLVAGINTKPAELETLVIIFNENWKHWRKIDIRDTIIKFPNMYKKHCNQNSKKLDLTKLKIIIVEKNTDKAIATWTMTEGVIFK